MAQGKKKRKIADKKLANKPGNKQVEKTLETTTEEIVKSVPEKRKETENKKKTPTLQEKKTTETKKKVEQTPKSRKEKATEDTNKKKTTKEPKVKDEINKKTAKEKSSETKAKTTTTKKKNSTSKNKDEQKSTTKKAEQKTNASKVKVQTKKAETKTETKKQTSEAKPKSKAYEKKETTEKNLKKENQKSKTPKKKEISSNKKEVEKKASTPKKETSKATKEKRKKEEPKQEKKATNKITKEQIQEIWKRIISFLLLVAKNSKKYAIKFWDFSKVQAKKCQKGLIHIYNFLKVVLGKIKIQCGKLYKVLKEKYKEHRKNRKRKKEEKRSKRIALKEQKEISKKILKYQKEQVEESNSKKDVQVAEEQEHREKKKHKFPKSIILLMLFIVAYLVATMLPYGTKEYVSGASGKIIDVPKLTKLKEECCNFKATFTSIRSAKSLEKEMENLIASYQKLNCDNKSYIYNPKGDYTITEYSITKGVIFNELNITYGKGNSCELDTTFKKLELLPNSFNIEDAKKDGNYVITNEKIFNSDSYKKFMQEVENKNPNTLRIVRTNEEGDLLITDVEYMSDGKIKVTYDKTRDRNNQDNYIMAYKYDHIGIYKNKLYAYNGTHLNDDVIKGKSAYYLIDIPVE